MRNQTKRLPIRLPVTCAICSCDQPLLIPSHDFHTTYVCASCGTPYIQDSGEIKRAFDDSWLGIAKKFYDEMGEAPFPGLSHAGLTNHVWNTWLTEHINELPKPGKDYELS